jgi:hypothetical protein
MTTTPGFRHPRLAVPASAALLAAGAQASLPPPYAARSKADGRPAGAPAGARQ